MNKNLKGVLIASILYPFLWIGLGLLLSIQYPTVVHKVIAGVLILAIFVDWFVIIANIVADTKRKSLPIAYALLGFFLTCLGGIIYFFIAKNKPEKSEV